VATVGGDEVPGADGDTVTEERGDPVLVLGDADQFVVALDAGVVCGRVLLEKALHIDLRHGPPRQSVTGEIEMSGMPAKWPALIG
jgi:hypothetical protein